MNYTPIIVSDIENLCKSDTSQKVCEYLTGYISVYVNKKTYHIEYKTYARCFNIPYFVEKWIKTYMGRKGYKKS